MRKPEPDVLLRLQEALVVARRIKSGRYQAQPEDLGLFLRSLEDFERWLANA